VAWCRWQLLTVSFVIITTSCIITFTATKQKQQAHYAYAKIFIHKVIFFQLSKRNIVEPGCCGQT